jgi:hypothetical protein
MARRRSSSRSNPRTKADIMVLHDMRAKRKSLDVLGDIEIALKGRMLSAPVARMARKYLASHDGKSRRNPKGRWKFETEHVGRAGYLGWATNLSDKWSSPIEVGPFKSKARALAAAKKRASRRR